MPDYPRASEFTSKKSKEMGSKYLAYDNGNHLLKDYGNYTDIEATNPTKKNLYGDTNLNASYNMSIRQTSME
jgi:hypothetical protein